MQLEGGGGGLGFVLFKGQELQVAMSRGTRSCCAIQAEAIALREAIIHVAEMGISECVFYSDNKSLAELCMALQPPLRADWRAFNEIFEIWKRFKANANFSCRFFARCHNELADKLARRGS